MKTLYTKAVLALALGATAITAAAPAEAQRYRGGHRGHDGTGTAIVAGIAGLAIGAAIASSSRRDRGYDDRRYDNRGYATDYNSAYYDDRSGYYDDQNGYPSNGYYQDGYRGGYSNGYSRCRVERRWDGYSGRDVMVRNCR
jgi:hypothetical protein